MKEVIQAIQNIVSDRHIGNDEKRMAIEAIIKIWEIQNGLQQDLACIKQRKEKYS